MTTNEKQMAGYKLQGLGLVDLRVTIMVWRSGPRWRTHTGCDVTAANTHRL